MKKLLSVLLLLAIAAGIAGCGKGGNDTSSVAAEIEPVKKSGGLYYDSTDSKTDGSASSEEVKSAESSSSKKATAAKKAVSKEESSITSSVAKKKSESKVSNTTSKYSVAPSDIYNPSGIVSADRKNNNGSTWYKTLVNPWNTLHKGYSVNLAQIDSRFASGKEFDARAVKYLNAMCEAALKDGIQMTVISAYRSYDYQQMLFDNQVASVKAGNPSLSDTEAKKQAATVVARPGTSEHSLGLAVDIDSVEETFENTPAFSWLQKHCTEYGFIMRYAKEKQSITGVIYEPWHYRYVGKELAQKITASGLCMEEWLKQNG